jgi:hypothetical protein
MKEQRRIKEEIMKRRSDPKEIVVERFILERTGIFAYEFIDDPSLEPISGYRRTKIELNAR